MVELNGKLVALVIGTDAFLLLMFSLMGGFLVENIVDYESVSDGMLDSGIVTCTERNNTSGDCIDQYEISSVSTFKALMWTYITGGMYLSVFSNVPIWLTIPFAVYMYVIHALLSIELVSWGRELLGFT